MRTNYSHSFRYGSNETIAFETAHYGLLINYKDLTAVLFRDFNVSVTSQSQSQKENDDTDYKNVKHEDCSQISYLDCLEEQNRERMNHEHFSSEELRIQLKVKKGDRFMPCTCIATHAEHKPRLWEAGRICQRYDFRGVKFGGLGMDSEAKNGTFQCTLIIVVWANSITFQVNIELGSIREQMGLLKDGFSVRLGFRQFETEESFDPKDDTRDSYPTILSCNFKNYLEKMLHVDDSSDSGVKIKVATIPKQDLFTDFDRSFNCFVIRSKNCNFIRPFLGGYRDIRDYDNFEVQIYNESCEITYVPILLEVQPLANPTGVCPIVCDEDYSPTGIPIQLSKNWHMSGVPPYGRFYCYLPAGAKKRTTYRIRLVYGFYGTLPSASHANLSLVGAYRCKRKKYQFASDGTIVVLCGILLCLHYEYRHNLLSPNFISGYHDHGTRWEQLSIGCWGETYCMDIDMGCTKRTITDVRTLMTMGEDKLEWSWSDAGWGGDWGSFIMAGARLLPFRWKCAYLSHGPCLTDVRYSGWYGEKREVYMKASVRTSRTDDYCRTLTSIKYEFRGDIPSSNASFFELGTADYIRTPIVAWGNCDGLIEERRLEDVPVGVYLNRRQIEGSGPWWFGFPGQRQMNDRKWGKGWRGIVIRNFSASFGNQHYVNPFFSLSNQRPKGDANIKFRIQAPSTVKQFVKGDCISFDLEVLTFPPNSKSYYGPNESFREHLNLYPSSWRSIQREVVGNTFSIKMHHGTRSRVLLKCPILIIGVAREEDVIFTIKGGIGAMATQFCGLYSIDYVLYRQSSCGDIPMNQSVHKNDFWQSEFSNRCAEEGQYSLTFNIQVDFEKESTWTLRQIQK